MPAIRVVGIDLDTRRPMLYRTSDIMDAERMLGKGILTALSQDQGLTTAVVLLWAGLKHADPKLNIEKAAKLADVYFRNGNNLAKLYNTITEALVECGVMRRADTSEGEIASGEVLGLESETDSASGPGSAVEIFKPGSTL